MREPNRRCGLQRSKMLHELVVEWRQQLMDLVWQSSLKLTEQHRRYEEAPVAVVWL